MDICDRVHSIFFLGGGGGGGVTIALVASCYRNRCKMPECLHYTYVTIVLRFIISK